MTTENGSELLENLVSFVKYAAADVKPTKENLRLIIEEVIEERVPRRIEFHVGDMKLGSIEEHTRPEFEKLCRAVFANVPVLISGPAGSGKTHVARQIATALGLRFSFLPLTSGISESRLAGRFVPIGANGSFEYVPAQFVEFYKNGGLFLLDEFDAADPNVMLVINAALANGHMETPNPAEPVIERHKLFRVIAAANTWGSGATRQYVGRNQLDSATLDRFTAKFSLGYDEQFERQVGEPALVSWVHQLRRNLRDVRRIVSTRLVLNGTKMMQAGFTLREVQESYGEDWTASEKSVVGWDSLLD